MRSVVVHLRAAQESEVTEYLARTYPFQPGPTWILEVAGDAVLYIYFTQVESWVAEGRDVIARCLGREPSVSVQADVSGRHWGDDQVRAFVCGMLEAFEGLAQDEYTDHCWSREQILGAERVQGHPFFDYQGWFESQYMGTESL